MAAEMIRLSYAYQRRQMALAKYPNREMVDEIKEVINDGLASTAKEAVKTLRQLNRGPLTCEMRLAIREVFGSPKGE